MGIGGIRGINIDFQVEPNVTAIQALFNEELGIILEVSRSNLSYVLTEYKKSGVNAVQIGTTGKYGMNSEVHIQDKSTSSETFVSYFIKNKSLLFFQVIIKINGSKVLDTQLIDVYRMWEETSYQLECLQANTDCVRQEWKGTAEFQISLKSVLIIQTVNNITFLQVLKNAKASRTMSPSILHWLS